MISATSYLTWGSNRTTPIHSLVELDEWLDHLTIEASKSMPFTVVLSVNDETSVMVVVGAEVSHMEFYSTRGGPLIVACQGPWDDDELIAFNHGGEYSEMERRYCVPIQDARAALQQYFQTGMRPDNVAWNDDRTL